MTPRLPIICIAVAVLLLVACKPKIPEESASTAPAASATAPPATAPASLPRFAPPARIAEIKASGQTGFWATPADFCPGRRVAVLDWNVEASDAQKVILYVVDKDGKERSFGRGGPIGERQTGPWLQPGLTFKLRNADGGAELGSITFNRGTSC
jgi:hypothetical protein